MQYYRNTPSTWSIDNHKYTWKEILLGWIQFLLFLGAGWTLWQFPLLLCGFIPLLGFVLLFSWILIGDQCKS